MTTRVRYPVYVAANGGTDCVRALPLELVVLVINGWGTAPRAAAHMRDVPYPDAGLLFADRELGLFTAANAPSDGEMVSVADALYPIFAAADEDVAVSHLNDVLRGSGVEPRLTNHAGTLVEAWATDTSGAILSAAALSLYRQLLEWGGARRIGTCAATRCVDAYIDSSPAGHKKFCSLSCQNRHRVAAFRARRASVSAA